MVSIIKNQLLKHLSRFTKNLSADKINLSTFKGEGELSNLELNEIVLTDLLELPSWLRITKAWCNKVAFKIPWRKLKGVPIQLNLDEVNITVETCEELRFPSGQGSLAGDLASGEYGFIHKVIDGITVTVNTVNVLFNSPAFTASVQISRILVESKTAKWQKCTDLRLTRLKDPEKGQVLLFKELEWQTVRIEAKSTIDKNLTPLRLITNQARCRMVIKKRLKDCFIMGSKLVIILDDLLWVLTDSQLKAALHFLDSLAGLVQKATQITRKVKAARKLQEFPEYQAQLLLKETNIKKSKQNVFDVYDVIETSYHFISNQIVLHLCDDPGMGRSSHANLKDGGALQINIKRFQIDFYPYHLAKGNRKHWPRYNESMVPHAMWQEQALGNFRNKFMDLLDGNNRNQRHHTPLSRSQDTNTNKRNLQSSNDLSSDFVVINNSPKEIRRQIDSRFSKLMTTCAIVRIEDFTIYKVTSAGKKQLKEFIAGDRDRMMLPKDSSIVHAEFIYYYYPGDTPFPLPPPKFYVQLNPIHLIFDIDSCLWFNSFIRNLYQSLLASKPDIPQTNLTYIDVKIEIILLKFSFESTLEYHNQKDRPKSLSFQMTRITITNVRNLEQSSRADLAKCVDSFHMGTLFFGNEFPSQTNDFYLVTQKFLDHISATDNIRNMPNNLNLSSLDALIDQLSRELLWIEAKDVWYINLDPIWGDFFGARAIGANKGVPFLDAIPITIWLHTHLDPNSTIKAQNNGTNADIHILANISSLVSLQINHYQYLFLLRLAEEISELMTFLSIDSSRIMKVEDTGSIAIGGVIPQLEITFVMPSQCPGKESSGGDVESFIPDTSSMIDDGVLGSTATVWQNSTLSMNQESKKFPNGTNNLKLTSLSMEYLPEQQQQQLPQQQQQQQQQSVSDKSNKTNLHNNLNAGLSSMKKGFSNLMSSLDSWKPGVDDATSDSLSIRSDLSSDSENLSINSMEPDAALLDLMFIVKEFSTDNNVAIEVASEVVEDDSIVTTNSDHSLASIGRRKDLISVSTFKLNKVEFLQQSIGHSSSIKVQIGNIRCDDCSSIPWDEFQAKMKSKFSSRSRAWMDSSLNGSTSLIKVKLRLDHSLNYPNIKSLLQVDLQNKENLRKIFKDIIIINVNDLNLDLTMSTVCGLTDLIEDEIIPTPIPLEVNLENVRLHLIEDRPPTNITSPGPIPIDLNINHLYITRSDDGTFNILPKKIDKIKLSSMKSEHNNKLTKHLMLEIEELKRRLVPFERLSEENHQLRKAKEENNVLKSCLSSAQDENARLLDEKRRLLEELRQLKETERGRQWSNKR